MNNGTNLKQPTAKQFSELSRLAHGKLAEVLAAYFSSASFDEMQATLKNGGGVAKQITKQLATLFANPDPHSALRAYWEKLYHDNYGLEADFSEVYVPLLPTEGRWRYIFILRGLTMNHATVVYKKIITTHDAEWNLWKYADDLDASVTDNIRTSAESYAICVRDEPEPDKQFLGKSTRDADPDKKIGVTLLERLVHGAVHFIETKKHLDTIGVTLCTGSRFSDGRVPGVYWSSVSREVCVSWYSVGFAFSVYGLRTAVS